MSEQKLWDYIDGNVSADEHSLIESMIRSDTTWQAKYKELFEVSQLLKSSELDAPSMRFTRNVMDEIARLKIAPATKSYINKRIIWGLSFFFITMFIGFLVYGFAQMTLTGGEESTITKNLPKFDVTKFFNNTWINIFMMINVVLALVLFDHYLSNKRKEFRKHA